MSVLLILTFQSRPLPLLYTDRHAHVGRSCPLQSALCISCAHQRLANLQQEVLPGHRNPASHSKAPAKPPPPKMPHGLLSLNWKVLETVESDPLTLSWGMQREGAKSTCS